MDGRSVYVTLDGSRWFNLPSDLVPPAGEFEVRGMLGQRLRADPAAIVPFEVTKVEGNDLARRELLGMLGSADQGIAAIRALMESQGKDGQALAPLQKVLVAVEQALRKRADGAAVAGAAPPTSGDLRARFEGWAKKVLEDPAEVEKLRQTAKQLEAAAAGLRAATRKEG